jgi:hypothetical protein
MTIALIILVGLIAAALGLLTLSRRSSEPKPIPVRVPLEEPRGR